MLLWQTEKLVQQLREGPLTESEQAKYFIAFVIFAVLGINFPIDSDARGWLGTYGFYKWFAYGIVGIVGVLLAYRTNCKGDSKFFLSRFVSLALPLTLRMLCLMVPPIVLVAFVPDCLPSQMGDALFKASWFWDWFWFALQISIELIFFWRMNVNLSRVSAL